MERNYTAPDMPDKDEVEIDLGELLQIVWQNAGRILIAALIGTILALVVTIFLIHPRYSANFTAFVNNRTAHGTQGTESIESGDVAAAKNLTYTYAEIIKSRPVLEAASKTAGLENEYTVETLQESVSTSVQSDTQLVQINVTLGSPRDAYEVAKAIASIAPDHLASIVEGSSMKIVAAPILPTRPSSPSIRRNAAIGFLIGLVLMILLVIVRHLMDNRIKSEQELEEKFGIPIVGSIPNFDAVLRGGGGYKRYYGKGDKD